MRGNCWIFADGAGKANGHGLNYYKVNRDSPVTKGELLEFSHDLMDTLKIVVGQVGANQQAIAT